MAPVRGRIRLDGRLRRARREKREKKGGDLCAHRALIYTWVTASLRNGLLGPLAPTEHKGSTRGKGCVIHTWVSSNLLHYGELALSLFSLQLRELFGYIARSTHSLLEFVATGHQDRCPSEDKDSGFLKFQTQDGHCVLKTPTMKLSAPVSDPIIPAIIEDGRLSAATRKNHVDC